MGAVMTVPGGIEQENSSNSLNLGNIAIKFKRLVKLYDKLPELQTVERRKSGTTVWQ
jgi:hypothetical protein